MTCATSDMGSLGKWHTEDWGGARQHSNRYGNEQKVEQWTGQRAQGRLADQAVEGHKGSIQDTRAKMVGPHWSSLSPLLA